MPKENTESTIQVRKAEHSFAEVLKLVATEANVMGCMGWLLTDITMTNDASLFTQYSLAFIRREATEDIIPAMRETADLPEVDDDDGDGDGS